MHTNEPQALAPWKKKLPMWLTWGRMVACIPLTVVMLTMDKWTGGRIAAAIFLLAAVTDWFDGYFARRFGVQSTLGKFMDPIADKILVSTVLILLVPSGAVHPVLVILLLGRDILIGGIRSIAAADQVIIDAKPTGKWKTGIQMVGIPAILLDFTPFSMLENVSTQVIGHGLLWISTVLSVISGWEYIQIYRENRRGSPGH